MEFVSEQKYCRISPTKVRPLASFVKRMEVDKALEILSLVPKKGSIFLLKVVKSAVANAVQKGFSISDLEFKEVVINEGVRFKRGRPVSRGMWHPYVRRTSHIRVVLQSKSVNKNKADIKQQEKNKSKLEFARSKNGVNKGETNSDRDVSDLKVKYKGNKLLEENKYGTKG